MLEGMIRTDLGIIRTTDAGSVLHAMRKSDYGFKQLSEVYFSSVNKGAVKAWKQHKEMTLNLVVPEGAVVFVFVDTRYLSETRNQSCKIVMSQDPYFRLTVPPKIWFGFKGLGDGPNLICNLSDLVHDPDEALRRDINELDTDWAAL